MRYRRGTAFNQSANYQSALANTNDGLLIYGIDKNFNLKKIYNFERFLTKLEEDKEYLKHKLEITYIIIKHSNYDIIIQEIPNASFELRPIEKEYKNDTETYYIKNHQLTIIPLYMLLAIRSINHVNHIESLSNSYKAKYDDMDLKTGFLEKNRKVYTTKYELLDTDIIKVLFPNYNVSIGDEFFMLCRKEIEKCV